MTPDDQYRRAICQEADLQRVADAVAADDWSDDDLRKLAIADGIEADDPLSIEQWLEGWEAARR